VTGLAPLVARLRKAEVTPAAAVATAVDALSGLDAVVTSWIPDLDQLVAAVEGSDPAGRPLWGVPFAVKDNIDVAGTPTSAGCPSFAYVPSRSATVVQRLVAAGAIPVAKTNLDQFATGLVGTRSPYGVPRNPFDPALVPGGSSSGSAVAVASGAVPFALGTDTAGSGRVPAAFCGIVGLKPTRGWISTRGVVPAVRTLDCVSVLALSVEEAWAVLDVAAGFDAGDPFSRPVPASRPGGEGEIRIGVAFLEGMAGVDVDGVEVDVEPLLEAGRLLYGGAPVAERLAVVGDFIAAGGADIDPTVASIILGGSRWSAVDAARTAYRLAELRREADGLWETIDVLVLPTAPIHPSVADVAADPIGVNAEVGRFTTCANLLDLCAVAVPTVVTGNGPTGLSVLGPAWHDAAVAAVAARLHPAVGGLRGVAGPPLRDDGWRPPSADVALAVVGAHLRGQPLHHQLEELGARFAGATTTTAEYRLYALAGTNPPKPGLVRVSDGGAEIEAEVYRLTAEAFGQFVAAVPAPLCIGTVRLRSGCVSGFLCEPDALDGATDITVHGGWRAYLATSARR
jgi:allophanate hydrolase